MEKIRWRKVFRLAIPLSIIGMIVVAYVLSLGRVSKLSDGDFIGKNKRDFINNEEVLLEKVVKIDLDDENYETFFFSDTNICIGHFQKAESKYFRDIYDKLVKRKGEPVGKIPEDENAISTIIWEDGTELSYHKTEGVQVRELEKGFEEYLKGL